MTVRKRELYASSNGYRWFLANDGTELFVEHLPNAPSGGRAERRRAFVPRQWQWQAPEQQALLRLIGTLLNDAGPRWQAD
jgi:hypothetical protein